MADAPRRRAAVRREAFDLPTYGAVGILLLGMAVLACYLPGLLAMRTDPAVALRAD